MLERFIISERKLGEIEAVEITWLDPKRMNPEVNLSLRPCCGNDEAILESLCSNVNQKIQNIILYLTPIKRTRIRVLDMKVL